MGLKILMYFNISVYNFFPFSFFLNKLAYISASVWKVLFLQGRDDLVYYFKHYFKRFSGDLLSKTTQFWLMYIDIIKRQNQAHSVEHEKKL